MQNISNSIPSVAFNYFFI